MCAAPSDRVGLGFRTSPAEAYTSRGASGYRAFRHVSRRCGAHRRSLVAALWNGRRINARWLRRRSGRSLEDNMRKPPDAGPAPLGQPVSLGRFTREYEIITPLLGGGVDAGKNDLYRLVREEQISGLLRVWLRVGLGGQSRGAKRPAPCEIPGNPKPRCKLRFHLTIVQ